MKQRARHAVIDAVTGELYDFKLVPRRRSLGGWVKLFQKAKVELLLGHPGLRRTSLLVLHYLEGVSVWHNQVPGPSEAAQALGLRRDVVSRAYSELLCASFIVKVGTRYHLSPLVVWKGTEREWEEFCRELYTSPEPKLLAIGGGHA